MKILFQEIINKAIEMKASDVHFIPVKNEVSIKFRINDNLEQYEQIGNSIYQKLLVYMKFQAGLDVSTQQVAQSGRYSYHFNKIYFLRISTLPLSLGQESCVIRIVPQFFQQQKSTYKFNDFKHLMNKKQGLLLFSGPTGSGKSTLMYQMVSYANKALNLNVISIEDPVEMQIPGIVQINVNDKAGINYVNSFKAILRCDPDVILIGEIRDKDVAKCVIQASLSGHLVLTTLHATDCKGAILRLLEMGISVQELIQATNLIINQRLVTTIKQQRQLSKAQQIDLLSNLCNLLKYGFTLYQSFQFLNLQMTYKNKQLGTTILSEISNGAPCNQILSLIGYSDTIVMQVYLAERFGNIIDVLEETVNYMKVNRKSEQRLLKTLQYPLILVSIFIAMIIILNLTVIPQFQQLYTSMNIQLSSFQKTLSFFITSLPTIIVVMLIIVSMLAIIMKLIYNKLNMLNKINFVMKLPLISGYFQLFKTYFVTNELVLFYKNGITLQSIVDVYINHSSDPFRQFLGKYLLTYSEMGYGLPQILEKLKCFKPQLIKFVLQGEKRGKLEVELKLYSQILVKQIEDKAIKQTQFLQPILFLILGLFIVAIYLVIMLPMFQMMQSIK